MQPTGVKDPEEAARSDEKKSSNQAQEQQVEGKALRHFGERTRQIEKSDDKNEGDAMQMKKSTEADENNKNQNNNPIRSSENPPLPGSGPGQAEEIRSKLAKLKGEFLSNWINLSSLTSTSGGQLIPISSQRAANSTTSTEGKFPFAFQWVRLNENQFARLMLRLQRWGETRGANGPFGGPYFRPKWSELAIFQGQLLFAARRACENQCCLPIVVGPPRAQDVPAPTSPSETPLCPGRLHQTAANPLTILPRAPGLEHAARLEMQRASVEPRFWLASRWRG